LAQATDSGPEARPSNWNAPNLLSLARIALTPVVIILLAADTTARNVAAFLVMGLCGITDMLDGRIARSKGIVTRLGAFLDPLADKFYIGGALIMLAVVNRITPWIPALILGRELGITFFRIYAESKGVSVPASLLGKLKANAQLLAILVVILHFRIAGGYVHEQVLMWLAVAITLASGADYILQSGRILGKGRPSRSQGNP
jgi:CDP-diacylglycerol--glycerol-3-phosphate 3-phosphatidyltransferase